MVGGDVLDQRELVGIAAHAVDQHELRLLLLGDLAHPAFSAVDQDDGVRMGLEHLAHFLEVILVGRNDGDLHWVIRGCCGYEQIAALFGSCRMISLGRKVEKVGMGMGASAASPAMGEIHW
jgi:hypothetical protein